MSALGQITPHHLGQMLGTGFDHFLSPTGLDGLARLNGTQLDILAVHASMPGHGQFRAFIEACKAEYDEVRILEVWNPKLGETLQRYGFTPFKMVENDEQLSGFRWKRN